MSNDNDVLNLEELNVLKYLHTAPTHLTIKEHHRELSKSVYVAFHMGNPKREAKLTPTAHILMNLNLKSFIKRIKFVSPEQYVPFDPIDITAYEITDKGKEYLRIHQA